MSMDVSVIIPNLHSKVVGQTIESLLSQETSHSFEIIVVGQDKFGLIPEHPKVKRIDTENPVYAGIARNIGASHAQGELLVFIDSDCIAESDFIEAHLEGHRLHPNSLIGGAVLFPMRGYIQLADNVSTFHEYMPHRQAEQRKILPSLNLSISANLFNQVGGFEDQPIAEDARFAIACSQAGLENWFLNEPRVAHHHPRNSMGSLLRHAFVFGKYSVLIESFFPKKAQCKLILSSLYLLSPFIAAFITLKLKVVERLPLAYWHTLPMVFIAKIAWCFGAARQDLSNQQEKPTHG